MAVIETIDMTECQTVSIREAAAILGVGMTSLYERAKVDGHIVPGLPILVIGTTRRIPRARLLAYARGDWTPEAQS